MLALTRKKDEAIMIGGEIEIKIIDIIGDKVRLGISAPKDIKIYREEIYLQVSESNHHATEISPESIAQIKKLFIK